MRERNFIFLVSQTFPALEHMKNLPILNRSDVKTTKYSRGFFFCFFFPEKVCPPLTIVDSVDTLNKTGDYGVSYTAQCVPGYKVQGEKQLCYDSGYNMY